MIKGKRLYNQIHCGRRTDPRISRRDKGLVERARSAHNANPVATAALGRLLTAGAMMGVIDEGRRIF